jgi:acyl-CoA thioesterase-1
VHAIKIRHLIVATAVCVFSAWVLARPAGAENRLIRIVALGDSLTAGYGLPAADAFPAQLERALKAKGYLVNVVNAGVTGDTAAMGLARLSRSIFDNTDAVILELGANDMLRGYEPSSTCKSLAAILENLKAHHIDVLLCGVRTQPDRGNAYKKAFAQMFADLANEHNLLFYPAFDEAFVDDARLKLSDDLHPTALGIDAVVTHILPKVEP